MDEFYDIIKIRGVILDIETFVVGVFQTNCYLVRKKGGHDAVLIDPGRGKNKIEEYCENLNIKICAVLITHGHFDHILEAGLWQEKGVKLYIHKNDAEKLYSDKNLGYMMHASVPQCHADVVLCDGDVIEEAGLIFKTLHTPGHSSGSVCYIIDDVIFTGDTLFHGDYGRFDFPDGNFEDLKKSLKKLFDIRGEYKIYPGHYETTSLAEERRSNAIKRDIE